MTSFYKDVADVNKLYNIHGKTQNYAWGKIGKASEVALLAHAHPDKVLQSIEDINYAEYWFGTHPNGPCDIICDGETDAQVTTLKQFLADNPKLLESKLVSSSGDLPYLFKVLSVNKALSIQAHPNIERAVKLHTTSPTIYKDPNHKPEMAIAITEFEALCGFESLSTIISNITNNTELAALLALDSDCQKAIQSYKDGLSEAQEQELLKTIFTALMKSEASKVAEFVSELNARLSKVENLSSLDSLALRLTNQYPGDVGVFCAYFLCYRILKPGQAVFLGANEPHAYLAGDCAEIMACSDNVVRAGLTPKLRDVDTLCDMLTYKQPSHSGSEMHPGNILSFKLRNENTKVYSPPDPAVTEFEIEVSTLKPGQSYELNQSSFGSIILVLAGEGVVKETKQNLARGSTFFQPADSKITFQNMSDRNELLFLRSTKKGCVI